MVIDCDVIIVGAGPAGSTAAKILTEQGIKSVLIDKEKFPRHKTCGGGLTSRTLLRFPYIKDTNVIESHSYGSCLYSSSLNQQAKLHKKEPVISMVRREKFDSALVKLAIDSGVQFQDKTSAMDVKLTPEKVQATLDDGTHIQADIIIGADGIFSTISKKSGLFTRHNFIGVAIVEEFSINEKTIKQYYTDERICYIHHRVHDIAGYGWVFPKKNCVNIGLVDYRAIGKPWAPKKNLKKTFEVYLSLLKNTNLIPKNIRVNHLRGGSLPFHPIKQTFTDRTIICGDAAGFINPLTGEGIYYALSSGEISAKVAIESIQAGDASKQFLSRYERLWKKDFGQEIVTMLSLAKQFGQQSEKLIELMCKDKKLLETLLMGNNWQDEFF